MSEFSDLVNECIQLNGDDDNAIKELADETRVSQSTLCRWREDRNTPHPIGQVAVGKFLNKKRGEYLAKFSELVKDYIRLSEENQKKLAREFGMSRPTIGRWADGDALPHPALIGKVINFIKQGL